jgi:hypothetical protein
MAGAFRSVSIQLHYAGPSPPLQQVAHQDHVFSALHMGVTLHGRRDLAFMTAGASAKDFVRMFSFFRFFLSFLFLFYLFLCPFFSISVSVISLNSCYTDFSFASISVTDDSRRCLCHYTCRDSTRCPNFRIRCDLSSLFLLIFLVLSLPLVWFPFFFL